MMDKKKEYGPSYLTKYEKKIRMKKASALLCKMLKKDKISHSDKDNKYISKFYKAADKGGK